MAQRSKIITLPDDIKAELDKRLLAGNFSDYSTMVEWLNGQLQERGLQIEISRSSLHRYGQDFEERLAAISLATQQAKAVAEAAGDDENAMNEALIRLIQTKTFDLLVTSDNQKMLPKLGIMISKLGNVSISQKKWMREMRKKVQEETAAKVEEVAKAEGISPESLKKIHEVLGIGQG
ncbi:MAG: DUF3486 family protein [Deltaproteobacteria bacterium]|nr:DUF3486 family protein [Deltaproteobacteria bacterium]